MFANADFLAGVKTNSLAVLLTSVRPLAVHVRRDYTLIRQVHIMLCTAVSIGVVYKSLEEIIAHTYMFNNIQR